MKITTLAVCLLAFTFWSSTCLGSNFVQAPEFNSKTQMWYGRVNYWDYSAKTLRTEITLMKKGGLTGYIIEMAVPHRSEMRADHRTHEYGRWRIRTKEYYRYLHRLCRKNGMWLFVCIVNDNSMTTKHGLKAISPRHYYGHVAEDLLKIVLADGPENVIVQPVSELYAQRVSNHPGPKWQKKAIRKLRAAGFKTCWNGSYGIPIGKSNCDYRAWHPGGTTRFPSCKKVGRTKTFIISDTGSIISEMNGGTDCDKIDADCDPAAVRRWRNLCIRRKFAVCGYYDYRRRSLNRAAIKAMSRRRKASSKM